jgi:hypothetical protein
MSDLIAEHPRTLLVVGYSESDALIVNEIIAPLDSAWRVTRIGPSVTGPDDIKATADLVLPILALDVQHSEEASAWHPISFVAQRDIGHALAGERLGAADVTACPQLGEVQLVLDGLRRDNAVVLNGKSGGGKSITAYQALKQLSDEGYEVLRLRDDARKRTLNKWLLDLAVFPQRKVLLVDDAQDLSGDVVRELAETATDDQRVLVVGVDHIAGGVTTYEISDVAAVGTLADATRTRAKEIGPKVSAMDDRVGEGLGEEHLDWRIDEAALATNAWHFFYTLTGGWRRTTRDALDLRSHDRADVALLIVAVAQIASVDAGATIEHLTDFAKGIHRDRTWLEACVSLLRERHLIVENDGVFRCVHLRAAWTLLDWMLHPPTVSFPAQQNVVIPPIKSAATADAVSTLGSRSHNPAVSPPPDLPATEINADRQITADLFCLALDSSSTSLRGAAWLLGRNHRTETRWMLRKYGVQTPDRNRTLVERALQARTPADAGMAAQLLERLLVVDEDELIAIVRDSPATILQWVQTVTPENGWAIGDLISSLSSQDKVFTEQALSTVDPDRLAGLIPTGGWPHIYSTTRAVGRITQGGGPALIRKVGAAFDPQAFIELAKSPPESLDDVDELLHTMAYTNRELGFVLFENLIPFIAGEISQNPPVRSQQIFETWAFLLGFAPRFLRGRNSPHAIERRLARKFVQALDVASFAAALSDPRDDWTWHNFESFIFFMWEANEQTVRSIANAMDVGALGARIESSLPSPSMHHLFAVEVLYDYRPAEAIQLLEAYEADYQSLNPMLAMMVPELAIRLLRRGLPLDLGLALQHWDTAGSIVAKIAALDPQIADELIRANQTGFIAGLAGNFSDPFEGLTEWLRVCDEYAAGSVDDVIRDLPANAVTSWSKALRKPARRREIGPLVLRAATSAGLAGSEAQGLMLRFPGLTK